MGTLEETPLRGSSSPTQTLDSVEEENPMPRVSGSTGGLGLGLELGIHVSDNAQDHVVRVSAKEVLVGELGLSVSGIGNNGLRVSVEEAKNRVLGSEGENGLSVSADGIAIDGVVAGDSSLVGGEVVVVNRVEETEILVVRGLEGGLESEQGDVSVGEVVPVLEESRNGGTQIVVESEVLPERNGEEGSEFGKGTALVGRIDNVVVGSLVMDGGSKEDGLSRSNGIIQVKAEEVTGLSEVGSVNLLGLGKLGLSSGDGDCTAMAEVIKKTERTEATELQILLPRMERTEEIAVGEVCLPLVDEKQNTAVHATDAHITLPDGGQKTASEAVSIGVDWEHGVGRQKEDHFLAKCVLGQENLTTGIQGSELSVAGLEEIEEDELQEEGINAQESQFSVGDFVWGKIKNHHWWPGRIYNPSDASDFAAKYRRRGRLLLAYFGNKTFAWCYPSQLKPFHKDFQQMSEQSYSASFLSAVEEALNELGRCVKLEITCSCVPSETRAALARTVSANAGIKEGVSGSLGRIAELSMVEFEPASFLARVRDAAQVVSISNMHELTMFRSRVSVFRWVNGYGRFPFHHELSEDSDSEDTAENQISDNTDFDGQAGLDAQNPTEGWISSPAGPSVGKRKKRSMAELLQENMDSELESDSGNVTEEGKVTGKPAMSSKKQKKNELIASPSTVLENENENENAVAKDEKSASSSAKRKKTKHFASPSIQVEIKTSTIKDDDVRNEGAILSSPRIRKKSKYLSPPYTLIGGSKGMMSSKDIEPGITIAPRTSQVEDSISGKDVEIETPKATEDSQNGESISMIAGQSIGSPPILKCSSETFPKKVAKSVRDGHKTPGSSSPRTPKVDRKTTPALEELYASADMMLSEFLSTALNTLYLKGNRSSKMVKRFFAKYRSSMYLRGSDFEIYNNYVADFGGRERKSPRAEQNSLGKGSKEAEGSGGKHAADFGVRVKKLPRAEHNLLGKDSKEAEGSGGKHVADFGVIERKSPRAEDNLLGKDSKEAEGSGGKIGPGGRKKKSIPTEPSSLGKDSNKSDQSVPKSGSGGRKRKSLSNEHVSLGKDSSEADLSVPKSGSVGRKRKSLSNEHVSLGRNSIEADQSEGKSGQKKRKRKDQAMFPTPNNKSDRSTLEKMGPFDWGAGNSGVDANRKEANGDNPVALLLTFAPGFPLPSREDLIKIFSKFGVLIESETQVSKESGCARVVYARSSDAEAACNSSDKSNDFGPFIVSCQLRYLSGVSGGFETNRGFHIPQMEQGGIVTPPPSSRAATAPPLRFIQQNLEIMMSMLSESAEKESSPEKLSPEVQANLAGEIKGLLKKVTTLLDSSS